MTHVDKYHVPMQQRQKVSAVCAPLGCNGEVNLSVYKWHTL